MGKYSHNKNEKWIQCSALCQQWLNEPVFLHFRSSHWRCSIKKGILRNFTKFTGKHLCKSLFFNKVAGLRPAILLKKRLWHRRFPVNFAKFLGTSFLQNTSGRLLLTISFFPSKWKYVRWKYFRFFLLRMSFCRTEGKTLSLSLKVKGKKFDPNKAGFFEGSFFWGRGGGQFDPPPLPSYFKKNLSSINITLYNC